MDKNRGADAFKLSQYAMLEAVNLQRGRVKAENMNELNH